MHSPDDTIPDVTISGSLAVALMEAMEWADHHAATHGEYRAELEIRRNCYALEFEALRSWGLWNLPTTHVGTDT